MSTRERELLTTVLAGTPSAQAYLEKIPSVHVIELQDGGMGSLRFRSSSDEGRVLGRVVAQAQFVDDDGVAVSIEITVDQQGDLYELDMWKVNFAELRRWPNADQIEVKRQ